MQQNELRLRIRVRVKVALGRTLTLSSTCNTGISHVPRMGLIWCCILCQGRGLAVGWHGSANWGQEGMIELSLDVVEVPWEEGYRSPRARESWCQWPFRGMHDSSSP